MFYEFSLAATGRPTVFIAVEKKTDSLFLDAFCHFERKYTLACSVLYIVLM